MTVRGFLEEWDDVQREERWPHGARLYAAFMLARDVEACAALLRGELVDPSRLDHAELAKARRRTLVQLVAPIDLLGIEDAA